MATISNASIDGNTGCIERSRGSMAVESLIVTLVSREGPAASDGIERLRFSARAEFGIFE